MTTINCWPTNRLRVLAETLKGDLAIAGDGFTMPPDRSEAEYWEKVAAKVTHLLEDSDDFAVRLADMVTEAVELCDPTCLSPSALFLSNMSVADSRLAMTRLGLKGVVVIGDACLDQAPPEDGIMYHCHPVLPASSDPCTRASEIAASVEFIRRNQPALVCSDLGDGLSAVVCAAFLASATPTSQSSGDVARDGLQQVERRRGPLKVELDDLEALEAYCAGLPIALRTPPSRPRLLDAKLPPFSIQSNPDNPFSGVGMKRTLEALDANDDEPLTPKGKVAVSKQDNSPQGSVKARLLGRVAVSSDDARPMPPPPPPGPLHVQVFESFD